jgi:hypothetical protein
MSSKNTVAQRDPIGNELTGVDLFFIWDKESGRLFQVSLDELKGFVGAVESVNGKFGSYVNINTDDIPEGLKKFVTAQDLLKLAKIRTDLGTNVYLSGDGNYRTPDAGEASIPVDNITERDALVGSLKDGQLVIVRDASDDPTITSGGALYEWEEQAGQFNKLSEFEALDWQYATQAQAEDGTNTTSVLTPYTGLRGFLAWVKTKSVDTLNTTSKFLDAAINELLAALSGKADAVHGHDILDPGGSDEVTAEEVADVAINNAFFELYVTPDGDNGDNGSKRKPMASVYQALGKANANPDVVHIIKIRGSVFDSGDFDIYRDVVIQMMDKGAQYATLWQAGNINQYNANISLKDIDVLSTGDWTIIDANANLKLFNTTLGPRLVGNQGRVEAFDTRFMRDVSWRNECKFVGCDFYRNVINISNGFGNFYACNIRGGISYNIDLSGTNPAQTIRFVGCRVNIGDIIADNCTIEFVSCDVTYANIQELNGGQVIIKGGLTVEQAAKVALIRDDLSQNVFLAGDGNYRTVDTGSASIPANDIAERDALIGSINDGQIVIVRDASSDLTVNSGSALYEWQATPGQFNKLAEFESLDWEFSTQSQAEDGTNNATVLTPLRALQGFLNWVSTKSVSTLNTTSKLLDGAINELFAALNGKADTNHDHDGTYEPEFSKNTAFNRDFGNTAATVCQGNDPRLSDARTPLAHGHTVLDEGGANEVTASDLKAGLDKLATLRALTRGVQAEQATLDFSENSIMELTLTGDLTITGINGLKSGVGWLKVIHNGHTLAVDTALIAASKQGTQLSVNGAFYISILNFGTELVPDYLLTYGLAAGSGGGGAGFTEEEAILDNATLLGLSTGYGSGVT